MEARQIKINADYRQVLYEIEGLMSAKRGTSAGDRLDALVKLVEDWEVQQHCLEDFMLQKP